MEKIVNCALTGPGTHSIDYGIEYLGELLERVPLKDYFRYIYAHRCNGMGISQLRTITFYCDISAPSIYVSKTIEIPLSPMPYSCFFEERAFPPLSTYGEKEAWAIKLGGMLGGYFIPAMRSLILTDWSHDEITVSRAQEAWPLLRQEMRLRRLAASPVLPKVEPAPVTVGCDPEFEMSIRGRVKRASSMFNGDSGGELGVDGSGEQVEMRPPYSEDPSVVVQRLRDIMAEFNRVFPDAALSTAGHVYPLGGHIHLGVEELVRDRRTPPSSLIGIMDDFLGKATLPLSGKARGGYAHLGRYENKPWGFEYRTPPAAIFVDPEIARISLAICQGIVVTYLKGNSIRYQDPPMADDYTRICDLTCEDTEKFVNFLENYSSKGLEQGQVLAYWLGKDIIPGLPPNHPVIREFRDEWNPAVRELACPQLEQGLASLSPEDSSKIDEIILYGLNRDRGLVSNLPILGMRIMSPSVPLLFGNEDGGIGLYVGLPYIVRKYIDDWKIFPIIDTIIQYIKDIPADAHLGVDNSGHGNSHDNSDEEEDI